MLRLTQSRNTEINKNENKTDSSDRHENSENNTANRINETPKVNQIVPYAFSGRCFRLFNVEHTFRGNYYFSLWFEDQSEAVSYFSIFKAHGISKRALLQWKYMHNIFIIFRLYFYQLFNHFYRFTKVSLRQQPDAKS